MTEPTVEELQQALNGAQARLAVVTEMYEGAVLRIAQLQQQLAEATKEPEPQEQSDG